jgi:hypothetical protein
MSTEEKLLKLVQGLLAKTKSGEIAWEKTASDEVFQVAFPSYTVRLSTQSSDENPDMNDLVVLIRDDEGRTIEHISDAELHRKFPNAKPYQLMQDLYTTARRQALGVDTVLDSLLSELG